MFNLFNRKKPIYFQIEQGSNKTLVITNFDTKEINNQADEIALESLIRYRSDSRVEVIYKPD